MRYSNMNLRLDEFKKEELRKRDCFLHPQLNTNPMRERDFLAGNRNKVFIEGVFLGSVFCREQYLI